MGMDLVICSSAMVIFAKTVPHHFFYVLRFKAKDNDQFIIIIKNEARYYLIQLSVPYALYPDVQFLPISGLVGTNMKTRVEKSICDWWNGPCLFEVLDSIEVPPRDPKGPLRSEITSISSSCESIIGTHNGHHGFHTL